MRGQKQLAPSPRSSPVEGEEGRGLVGDFDAGVASQTALSGSQVKPPALPDVHDSGVDGWRQEPSSRHHKEKLACPRFQSSLVMSPKVCHGSRECFSKR
jgi:hypothetical protein